MCFPWKNEMITLQEVISIQDSKLTTSCSFSLSSLSFRRRPAAKLLESFSIKYQRPKHSMSLCQVPSCLVLVRLCLTSVCGFSRLCCRVCVCVCVYVRAKCKCCRVWEVPGERACVPVCAFCTSFPKRTSGVCRPWPAAVRSDSLPLRRPPDHRVRLHVYCPWLSQ